MEALIIRENSTDIRLNTQQSQALTAMIEFVQTDTNTDIFILNGAAGTGKTTILKAFTDYLENMGMQFFLFAPTGRATKVLANRTGEKAKTLHSFLYTVVEKQQDEIVKMEFRPRSNFFTKPTVFIIDEASMISDLPADNELFISKNSILSDLISYYKNSPQGSKVLFVGDHFQLPPINESTSVALAGEIIEEKFKLKTTLFTLTDVIRQHQDSYIHKNAEMLRRLMERKVMYAPPLRFKNVYNQDLAISHFCKKYHPNRVLSAIFIGWKNLTVSKLNDAIRRKLYSKPTDALIAGEQIVLCRSHYKNNYLPSGETGNVLFFDANSIEKIADHVFAEADFQFTMPNNEVVEFNSKFDLNFLISPKPDESLESMKKLWSTRMRTNRIFRESRNPSDDPYLSALKIKYGYAITTHKAQGGEWDAVFLYPETPFDENRLRWLYTAVTRAKNELYSF